MYNHDTTLFEGIKMTEEGFYFSESIEWQNIFEEIDRADIPERQKKYMKFFHTTQCSWCQEFYTNEPFRCFYGKLQSNCDKFKKLNERDREIFAGDKKWWWRMYDMLVRVEEKGILTRCRNCFALNPNPQKRVCWKMEEKDCVPDSLLCPDCHEGYLIYNINTNKKKCMKQGCKPKNRFLKDLFP